MHNSAHLWSSPGSCRHGAGLDRSRSSERQLPEILFLLRQAASRPEINRRHFSPLTKLAGPVGDDLQGLPTSRPVYLSKPSREPKEGRQVSAGTGFLEFDAHCNLIRHRPRSDESVQSGIMSTRSRTGPIPSHAVTPHQRRMCPAARGEGTIE